MSNLPADFDCITLKIPCSDALEESEYLQNAIMDAIENRSKDAYFDAEQSQNTTYYLMKLLRAVIPAAA